MYVNGVEQSVTYATGSSNTNAFFDDVADLDFGGWGIDKYDGTSFARAFDGFIDDGRVYNRSLTSSEVAGLYNYDGLEPQTFTVTNTLDDGSVGSLRWAITQANATAGTLDRINFNIAGTGVHIINVGAALPTITDAVILDATTDDSYATNSSRPAIILDGNDLSASGLTLAATADGSEIRGLVIRDFTGHGIHVLAGSDNHTIAGNYLGSFLATGLTAGTSEANAGSGIYVAGSGTTIGGTLATDRNVLSGNSVGGVFITGAAATGNTILGNYVGVDATGNTSLANAYGIFVANGSDNTIGGTSASSRNVISGNTNQGIYLDNADNSIVQGNYIGTNAAGTADVNGTTSNSNQSGITLINGTTGALIGGTVAGAGNLISGNNWNGIDVIGATSMNNTIQGNRIGTDATGLLAIGNTSSGVSFWGAGTGNIAGGNVAGAGNVVSGNLGLGMYIGNASASVVVQGNIIGLGINGSTIVANTWTGIEVVAGSTNTLIGSNGDGTNDANERNVISGNANGIFIDGAGTTGTMVYGNYIGTDSTGLLDRGNTNDGIRIRSGATANTIGGSGVAHRNIISGNDGDGIEISGETTDGNSVRGNWIGVNATGDAMLSNRGDGISIVGGADNTLVGGIGAGEGNWIVASNGDGIEIDGASTGTIIYGNRIGTDLTGTLNWGTRHAGITITGGASNTAVGGTATGQANVIAFSGQGGVNPYGVTVETSSSTGNTIAGNSIYGQTGIAIDLGFDGVSENDTLDPDTGANSLQNFPLISSTNVNAAGTTVTVSGSINTTASLTGMVLHFYATPASGNYARRDAKRYLGSTTVNTDAGGNATFTNVTLTGYSGTVAVGEVITATATHNNNTSELSQAVVATSSAGNTAPGDLTTVSNSQSGLQLNDDGGNGAYLLADDGGTLLGGRDAISYEVRFATTRNSGDTTLISYATADDSNEFSFIIGSTGDLRVFLGGTSVAILPSTFDFRTLRDGTEHTIGLTWDGRTGNLGAGKCSWTASRWAAATDWPGTTRLKPAGHCCLVKNRIRWKADSRPVRHSKARSITLGCSPTSDPTPPWHPAIAATCRATKPA